MGGASHVILKVPCLLNHTIFHLMSYNLVGVVFGGILIAGGVGLKVVFWKKKRKTEEKRGEDWN